MKQHVCSWPANFPVGHRWTCGRCLTEWTNRRVEMDGKKMTVWSGNRRLFS